MQKNFRATDFSVIWQKQTDSTNLDASRNKSAYPSKTVWAADFQTAGRGQRGNVWKSSRNENLTFSILLKPDGISAERQFVISQAASVAVVRYLENYGIGARIKWPNDIYVNDRKICGMLIEQFVSDGRLSASIVGIGLNVAQTCFPDDLPNPTSMALCLSYQQEWNPEEELVKFLSVFGTIYDSISDERACLLLDRNYDTLLYRKGEWHQYREMTPDGKAVLGEITGCVEGVDKATSRLKVRTSDGNVKLYAFKEIAYII